jgi:predicted RNA methylase
MDRKMKELNVLIEVLERDLEVMSSLPMILTTNPPRCLQDEKRQEIETLKKALEIVESYHSNLVESCLI